MSDSISLDVFGTRIIAMLTQGGWELSVLGDEGKRRPVENLVVPPNIRTEPQLIEYLNDVYHEAATAKRPGVVRLD